MKLVLILSVFVAVVAVACGSDGASEPSATPTPRPSNPIPLGYIPVLEQPTGAVKTPDFTLPSATGGEVSLSDYVGKQPVAVVFYRGFF